MSLKENFVKRIGGRLSKILQCKMLLEYFTTSNTSHVKYLKPIKHMSSKSMPMIHLQALNKLKTVAKARQDFLEFKIEDGGLIGADVSKSDLSMLQNAKLCILTNKRGIRDKAIKGAFAAYVSLLMTKTQGKAATGMRHEQNYRNCCIAQHLMSTASAN